MIRYFHGFQSIDELDFEKVDGLMPAIVQDCQTGMVLMMGYMTKESLQKTLDTGYVTFFSRTRQKLWTKGEESGHFLHMRSITCDCDKDTLLVLARPNSLLPRLVTCVIFSIHIEQYSNISGCFNISYLDISDISLAVVT